MMRKQILAIASAGALAAIAQAPASAQSLDEAVIGDIIAVGFGYCPRNYQEAAGQLLPIMNYQALYSLLGTTYGGDGRSTFALPNLQGRIPVHMGTGTGLSPVSQGQASGSYQVTLTTNNLPSHSHTLNASTGTNDTTSPQNAYFATLAPNQVAYTSQVNTTMDSDTIGNTGGNTPVAITAPTIALRYCIATQGVYPSRN